MEEDWKKLWAEMREEEPPIGARGPSLDEVKVRMRDGRIISGAEAAAEYEEEEAQTKEPGLPRSRPRKPRSSKSPVR